MRIIGVYRIPETTDAVLVEVEIPAKPSEVDLIAIRQMQPDSDPALAQVPYDEHYLNSTGTKVIARGFDRPNYDLAPTRLAFFLFFPDFGLPLQTQFGQVSLPQITPLPDRLAALIKFENVD